MFNTPILDVVIGLVFIFLLYSLLVTSINEAIATSLGLRAKMLKKGIVSGMLSDTANHNIWVGVLRRFWERLKNLYRRVFFKLDDQSKTNLGAKFYKHPLIRNYGSSEFYPYPTYIPKENFSTVVIDVLCHDFEVKLQSILEKYKHYNEESLKALSAHDKLQLLFQFYTDHYNSVIAHAADAVKDPSMIIDKDTLRILMMHLRNSDNDLATFTKNLEKWFDDTMYRVSGWYKRQAQYILFALGLFVAIVFNVDTIEIAGKLSKDKNLREQMVNAAIAYSKEHPELATEKKAIPHDSTQTANDTINFETAKDKWREVNKILATDQQDLRNLIALGWDDYGKKKEEDKILSELLYKLPAHSKLNRRKLKHLASRLKEVRTLVDVQLDRRWNKFCFVAGQVSIPKKFFGLILTAFAISLGAPFWFDLLNKLINLRGSEKQGTNKEPDKSVTVNVHADKKTTD